MTRENAEIRAGLLVRISDDDAGDGAGVARQEKDGRALAERLGWPVSTVYTENDTSAFKRRKIRLPDGSYGLRTVRPEFRRLLDDMATGLITAVVAYDLDRVARDPRDLEDMIDVVEENNIPTKSVTGSLDLSTDSGITMARVMVAVANKSSRDTSRRIKRKQEDLAAEGKPKGGGRRPYGYSPNGMEIIEAEAEVLRGIADDLLHNGMTLDRIARKLNAEGVPTVYGKPWRMRSVHGAITKARVAGLRESKGEIVGEAVWPAILDRDVWESVIAKLAERGKGTNGTFRRWLNRVLVCGNCQKRMRGWSSSAHRPQGRYWCVRTSEGHDGCGVTTIDAEYTHDAVEALLLGYLSRPDVFDQLTTATSEENTKRTRQELAEDQAQLAELAAMLGARELSRAEWLAARAPVQERIERAEKVLRATVPGEVRRLLTGDIRANWADLEPAGRWEVCKAVFPSGILVKPHDRTRAVGAGFDANRLVPLDWVTADQA